MAESDDIQALADKYIQDGATLDQLVAGGEKLLAEIGKSMPETKGERFCAHLKNESVYRSLF